ncbi:galactokinase [Coraliomargarita sinensis]|uniref:Galactokinase n=1 Tax=Coraliomargarita sinensis TaxID=2174842 RepID=A0A317ZD16_9BACT|nr:galactokinase [Coraliomargarita sinensis]PXA02890.1 galactokinase [Coraliomargarita sinensis]
MKTKLTQLFTSTFGVAPTQMAFAPGRIEFIGNHTDYNGGLVMGAAVTEGITVAASKREDREIHLICERGSLVVVALDQLEPIDGDASWSNYPVGVTKVLLDSGMSMDCGYNLAVVSNLPIGAGMSSSAAIELATAYALAALFGFDAGKADFARIGRKAENEFVGMPCGILDQGVSAFGQADHLVRIDCATEDFSTTPMPEGTHFWIFNSNKKHALVDSAYADRHKECHDALARLQIRYPDAKTLSEISLEQLEAAKDDLDELLYRRAAHIVGENARVSAVQEALASGDLSAVGAALTASHESSRVNFENSIPELDFLAQTLSKEANVYGARLTGGGFGGAVMAFTSADFSLNQARAVTEAYCEKFGFQATILHTQAGAGAYLF